VFPEIGYRPIADVSAPMLLGMIKKLKGAALVT
jgi:hypothetical protein